MQRIGEIKSWSHQRDDVGPTTFPGAGKAESPSWKNGWFSMIEALSASVSFYLKECAGDPVWGVHHSGTLHPRHTRCVVCLVVEKDHVLNSDWRVPDTRPDPIIFGRTRSIPDFFFRIIGYFGYRVFQKSKFLARSSVLGRYTYRPISV